jgi:hypothetical protein
MQDGVLIEAGDVFFDRDTSPLNYFRLSYSAISADRIPEGIARLAASMRKVKTLISNASAPAIGGGATGTRNSVIWSQSAL